MADYNVKITVRNGRILGRIKEMGYQSVAAFCRDSGIREVDVNSIICNRITPMRTTGEPREVTIKLCNALHRMPEEMFTERQMYTKVERCSKSIEMEESALLQWAGTQQEPDLVEDLTRKEQYQKLLSYLNPREAKVVKAMCEGATLAEVGEELDVSAARIRQIHDKALRKLRHPLRLHQCGVRFDSDYEPGGQYYKTGD